MDIEALLGAALREAGYGQDAIGSAMPRILRILEAEDVRIEMGRNLSRRVETLIECLNDTVKAQIVNQIMAANMADEAQSWTLQPDGRYLRHLPAGRDDLFNCHRFFMENPSLSGRGTAGARDVPALTHSAD